MNLKTGFKYYKEILQLFYKASLFVIPIWILNSNLLVQLDTYKGEHIGVYLPFLSAFLLGFLPLFRKKEKYFVVSIWAIYFMLMLLNARRNVSLSLALYAFIAYIFSILHNIKRRPAKYLFICVFTLISFLFIVNVSAKTTYKCNDGDEMRSIDEIHEDVYRLVKNA